MKQVVIAKSSPLFLQEEPVTQISFDREDYLQRLELLRGRMKEKGLDFVAIFGDREHFAHIDYFSGFDCRFEEGLLVVGADKVSIFVGNEGVSQTYPIPYDIDVYLYQNFSLQGQPRDQLRPLWQFLREIGVEQGSKLGLCGFKYFEPGDVEGDPDHTYDVPAYLLDELDRACGLDNVINFTRELTGFPNGIRMQVRTAKELAWIENAGNRSAGVVQRMLKALKPGLREVDVAVAGKSGFDPVSMFSLVNFGPEKVRVAVASPTLRQLELGEVCTLCYGSRGNLTSRVSIAAYGEDSVAPGLREHLDFYRDHWYAATRWLEKARVGASCAELYDSVMDLIGDPKYGVTLNPTHYSGADEWVNSPMHKNSPYEIMDGSHIQVDIIATRENPVMTSICEDCVVVAGEGLREELRQQYPEAWARIKRRQDTVREVLGIQIHDDLLPMSNLNFAFYPYMLNLDQVFALR